MRKLLLGGAAVLLLASCSTRKMPLVQGPFERFQPQFEAHQLGIQKDSLLPLAHLREHETMDPEDWSDFITAHKSDTLGLWVLANLSQGLAPEAKAQVQEQFRFLDQFPGSKDPLQNWLRNRYKGEAEIKVPVMAEEKAPKAVELSPLVPKDSLALDSVLRVEITPKRCKKQYDSLWLSAYELEQSLQFDSSLSAYARYLKPVDSLSQLCAQKSFKDQEERRQIAWFRVGFVYYKQEKDSSLRAWFSKDSLNQKNIMNRGSALLLLAKSAERANDSLMARKLWQELLSDHPINYYGWRARMQIQAPAPYQAQSGKLFTELKCKNQSTEGLGRALSLSLAFSDRELSRSMLKKFSSCVLPDSLLAWAQLASIYQDPGLSYQLARRVVENFVPRQNLDQMNSSLASVFYPRPYAEIVRSASEEFKIDSFFIWSIMRQESTFEPMIQSQVGATGLMQLMPATARFLADSLKIEEWNDSLLSNPQYNIRLGAYYLSLLQKEHASLNYAIAHYNAGPGPSRRWEKWAQANPDQDLAVEEISFRETRDYVKKVLSNLWNYRALYGGQP